MPADPKVTAAQVLRLVSASIGLASAPMKSGPYSWIADIVAASATCAADVLEAEPIDTMRGASGVQAALTPVFDALPEVRPHDAMVCAEFVVVATRIVRRWVS